MSNNNSIQEVRIGNWHHMNTGQQLLAAWYWTALTVSIIFILIIPVNWYLPDFLPGITGRMNLGVENFLGAWWSGVLLFVLASHSYDAGAAAHDRAPKISGAWMIISAILLFFSADEIGSLHERLSLLGDSLEVGGWTFLLPLGGIIGVFLTYALYTFWQSGDELRSYVLPLLIGFGLLGSVAMQEFVEHAVDWGSGSLVWIRLMIEEGTELAGMIVLLRVLLRPSMKIAGGEHPADRRLFTALSNHPRQIIIVLFALIPVFTMMTVLISDHRGRLTDWLTVISFVTAGLFTFSRVMSGETTLYMRYSALAALCIAASISPMYFGNAVQWSILDFDVGKETLALSVICVFLCATWLVTMRSKSYKTLILIVFFGIFAAAAPIIGAYETFAVVAMQVLAVMALMITYLLVEEPRHIR
jgi:hypothetical protein